MVTNPIEYSKAYLRYENALDELERRSTDLRALHGIEEIEARRETKIRGALFNDVVRELLVEELDNQFGAGSYVVSLPNSYILGSKYEYDLLVMKGDAKVLELRFFLPTDVLAIVECKTGGLYNVRADVERVSKSVNAGLKLNPSIRFGYISLWENFPKNLTNRDGRPTVNHREQTKNGLLELIEGKVSTLFLTTKTSHKIIEASSDDDFKQFAFSLVDSN